MRMAEKPEPLSFQVIAFDADDTLWHGQAIYAQAIVRFKQAFADRVEPERIERALDQRDIRNIPAFGYGIKSFTLSMIETAVESTGGRIRGLEIQALVDMAREMLDADPRLFDHAEAVLDELSSGFDLMVITQGDLLEQQRKLERSGLRRRFRYVEVVTEKTPATYQAILAKYEIDPGRFLMVGNSLRSDILPVIRMGGTAIHIPYADTWHHENASAELPSKGSYHEVAHLGQVPALIDRVNTQQHGSTGTRGKLDAPDNKPEALILPAKHGYDVWSGIYDTEDNPLITLEERMIRELLGDVRGRTIADIGCGTGRHAVRMAQAGARVTALDFSQGMLDKARSKPGSEQVKFVLHDLAEPLPLGTGEFDTVTCCLVVDHIADLAGFFGELARVLETEGAIVVSVMHPAMNLLGVQARFTDPNTGKVTRPESQRHQVGDYVRAVDRAGLRLDHISEHSVDGHLAERSPRAAKYINWPLLLLLRLTKPNNVTCATAQSNSGA